MLAHVPEYHCSDIAPRAWIVFELRGAALVPLHAESSWPRILQVLDLNADGRLEFLTTGDSFGTEAELSSPDPDGPAAQSSYHYMDCPC